MKTLLFSVGLVIGCAAVIAADLAATIRDYQRGMFYE